MTRPASTTMSISSAAKSAMIMPTATPECTESFTRPANMPNEASPSSSAVDATKSVETRPSIRSTT
ncbi:hypothetical protein HNP71_001178 [Acidocella aromatica]|uniref:Uncharacterized protein n=1 Tax=Acidocella aromatica TaxID=1303579 RepID=A0A840VDI0_9PROT|nr:hypothetical protein [Acidocella aromatica]